MRKILVDFFGIPCVFNSDKENVCASAIVTNTSNEWGKNQWNNSVVSVVSFIRPMGNGESVLSIVLSRHSISLCQARPLSLYPCIPILRFHREGGAIGCCALHCVAAHLPRLFSSVFHCAVRAVQMVQKEEKCIGARHHTHTRLHTVCFNPIVFVGRESIMLSLRTIYCWAEQCAEDETNTHTHARRTLFEFVRAELARFIGSFISHIWTTTNLERVLFLNSSTFDVPVAKQL